MTGPERWRARRAVAYGWASGAEASARSGAAQPRADRGSMRVTHPCRPHLPGVSRGDRIDRDFRDPGDGHCGISPLGMHDRHAPDSRRCQQRREPSPTPLSHWYRSTSKPALLERAFMVDHRQIRCAVRLAWALSARSGERWSGGRREEAIGPGSRPADAVRRTGERDSRKRPDGDDGTTGRRCPGRGALAGADTLALHRSARARSLAPVVVRARGVARRIARGGQPGGLDRAGMNRVKCGPTHAGRCDQQRQRENTRPAEAAEHDVQPMAELAGAKAGACCRTPSGIAWTKRRMAHCPAHR